MWDGTSFFARSNFRHCHRLVGVKPQDRLSHIYIIGKTGVGKSTLIETLALQDVKVGRGFALIDPHGDLVERVYRAVSEEQRSRIVYLDAPNRTQPFGYNPLRRVRDDKLPLAVSGLIETFKKLWPDAWGVRMEHVLRNTLYALLERQGSVLTDILRMYTDDKYRRDVSREIRNETVRRFWQHEFEHYHFRQRADAVAPIQNKLGALLSDPTLYRILVAPQIDLSFRTIMDEGRIVLVNLAKGRLGEESSTLLGSLIVSTLGLAAFSRAETESEERSPFYLYIDEFQSFTTLMLANMMSELRKYGVGLTLAHQHFHQLDADIRHAVLGNVGTIISFRVGVEDAAYLAREFQPTFDVRDLVNLPNRSVYLKLMIDGTPSAPFSAETIRADSRAVAEVGNRNSGSVDDNSPASNFVTY